MIFNSIAYALFLPMVFVAHWSVRRSTRMQNVVLLIASYAFYGAWDYRFLSLLFVSTITDYLVGRKLGDSDDDVVRKRWLSVSLVVNLGILGFFKYFNFFVDSASALLENVGFAPNRPFLAIVLPVGISFYTFQTISYTFDVYRRRLEPTQSLLNFAVYVSFFPQLVAGPIERARHFLPQIEGDRSVDLTTLRSGLLLILIGLFKKVAIADVMAGVVNDAFGNAASAGWPTLLVGVYAFSLQIYGDFSGYTDIARGSARLFGIELMENFRQPYLSRNITEFWRTWHISLSNWLRDYLYIPLGGNREGRAATYRNLLITMLLGGLWHGAGWNFVVWGGLHGIFLAVHRRWRNGSLNEKSPIEIQHIGKILLTFHLVSLTWVFFRATTFQQSIDYLSGIAGRPGVVLESHLALLLPAAAAVLAIDLGQRLAERELFFVTSPPFVRAAILAAMIIPIIVFSGGQPTPFIYFQF